MFRRPKITGHDGPRRRWPAVRGGRALRRAPRDLRRQGAAARRARAAWRTRSRRSRTTLASTCSLDLRRRAGRSGVGRRARARRRARSCRRSIPRSRSPRATPSSTWHHAARSPIGDEAFELGRRARPARPLVGPPVLAGRLVVPVADREPRPRPRVRHHDVAAPRTGDARRVHGFLYDRDALRRRPHGADPRRRAERATTTPAGTTGPSTPRSLTDDHTYAVEGDVWSNIPLRNRRNGLMTRITEGMTRWSCEGLGAPGSPSTSTRSSTASRSASPPAPDAVGAGLGHPRSRTRQGVGRCCVHRCRGHRRASENRVDRGDDRVTIAGPPARGSSPCSTPATPARDDRSNQVEQLSALLGDPPLVGLVEPTVFAPRHRARHSAPSRRGGWSR